MSNDTITIKVVESGSESRSQETWKLAFDQFCRRIVASGEARQAHAHVVFPHNPNPAMATIFTINVESSMAGIEGPLRDLQCMPGVMSAAIATSRLPQPVTR